MTTADDSSSLQYNQQNLRHAKNRGFYAPKDIFEQLFPNLSHCSQCLCSEIVHKFVLTYHADIRSTQGEHTSVCSHYRYHIR